MLLDSFCATPSGAKNIKWDISFLLEEVPGIVRGGSEFIESWFVAVKFLTPSRSYILYVKGYIALLYIVTFHKD